jgi:hypothetical protein
VSTGESDRSAAAAAFLASFLACLSRLRSRSRLSRLSFAIVVFFLPLEAMFPSEVVAYALRAAEVL